MAPSPAVAGLPRSPPARSPWTAGGLGLPLLRTGGCGDPGRRRHGPPPVAARAGAAGLRPVPDPGVGDQPGRRAVHRWTSSSCRSRSRRRRPSCWTSPGGTIWSGCRSASRSVPAPHVRENRKGRTGADSAYVLHAGTPGFGFAEGEVWAVHTALERQPHPLRRAGLHRRAAASAAASCSCPARCGWARARATRAHGCTARTASGLDAVARRFHRHLRGRAPAGLGRPPGDPERLGGGLLRPRPRPAGRAGRARGRGRASSGTCSTTGGSARAATTAPGSATGSCPPTSGRTACIRWSTGSRGLGMQFGLWFEPEMVNPDSDLARAHPEWIMAARGRLAGRVPPPAGAQPRHPRGLRARQGADPRACSTSTRSTTSSGTTTAT